MRRYFAIHDSDKENNIPYMGYPVDPRRLPELNARGYGIFFAVNELGGNGYRCNDNVVKINSWICDIDDGSKEEQLEKINNLIILPSFIIESQRGFHCYWVAEDATKENFEKIESGLIKILNGDENCKDMARVLRVPGFYHMKDPQNPYMVKVYKPYDGRKISEKRMLMAYYREEPKKKVVLDSTKEYGSKDVFLKKENWDRVFKLNGGILEGCRNAELARVALWMTEVFGSKKEVSFIINGVNQMFCHPPLKQSEVDYLVNSKF